MTILYAFHDNNCSTTQTKCKETLLIAQELTQNCAPGQFKDARIFISETSHCQQLLNRIIGEQ